MAFEQAESRSDDSIRGIKLDLSNLNEPKTIPLSNSVEISKIGFPAFEPESLKPDNQKVDQSQTSFSKNDLSTFLSDHFDKIDRNHDQELDSIELDLYRYNNGLTFKQQALLQFSKENFYAFRDLSKRENGYSILEGITQNDIYQLKRTERPHISPMGFASGVIKSGILEAATLFGIGGLLVQSKFIPKRYGKTAVISSIIAGFLKLGDTHRQYGNQRTRLMNLYESDHNN